MTIAILTVLTGLGFTAYGLLCSRGERAEREELLVTDLLLYRRV